jgi:hypothetical protein
MAMSLVCSEISTLEANVRRDPYYDIEVYARPDMMSCRFGILRPFDAPLPFYTAEAMANRPQQSKPR